MITLVVIIAIFVLSYTFGFCIALFKEKNRLGGFGTLFLTILICVSTFYMFRNLK